jgi:enterochelin esterase-like enzyme
VAVAPARVATFSFYSPALGRDGTALVYLPPGYAHAAATGQRFGVMYLLHGAPGDATNMFGDGRAGIDATALIDAHRIRPMILVAPYGRYGSRNETEWANGRAGAYESFVSDVVRATDRTFATIPDRAHRVIAGDSEGAYGAINITLHHLRMFGGFQSWSGYFTEQPTGTFAGASPVTIADNSPLYYISHVAPEVRRLGLHAFLYVGARNFSSQIDMPQFTAELRASGAHVVSTLYTGGHTWGLWHRQMPHMLTVASQWMYGYPRVLPHAMTLGRPVGACVAAGLRSPGTRCAGPVSGASRRAPAARSRSGLGQGCARRYGCRVAASSRPPVPRPSATLRSASGSAGASTPGG